jgi:hypothetical protein
MKDNDAYRIIASHLAQLVSLMVTVRQGTHVDVFCDPAGKDLAIGKPSGAANIKLCSVTAPDLEGSYALHRNGNSFVTDDGEEIPEGQLASRLTQYITDLELGGGEWGWEFKLSGG